MSRPSPTPLHPAATAGAGAPARLALDPERQRMVRRSLWVLAGLGSGSMLGVAFSLYLVNHFPLLLIALSPLGRHLILVAPVVAPEAFLAVLVARRLAFYLACFQLGRALGPLGIPWIEARAARLGGFVRWLERIFARASHLVVLALAGPTVSALAGISGMRLGVFSALASASLLVRGLLVLGLAAWLNPYLEIARAWIEEWWVPGTVVMVLGVALYRWRRRAPIKVMED